MLRQLDLFATGAPGFDAEFRARKLLLRPTEGGASISFALGRGDLVVMGGTCQRTWRHGIPKVADAGPRIALMFRPKWARNYRTSVDE